jgi:hypothetical protein
LNANRFSSRLEVEPIEAMTFQSILTTPSKPLSPAYSYGMLVIILGLLGWSIHARMTYSPAASPGGHRNFVLIVPILLLANHLASQFRLPPLLTALLRIFAMGWLIFSICYLWRMGHGL